MKTLFPEEEQIEFQNRGLKVIVSYVVFWYSARKAIMHSARDTNNTAEELAKRLFYLILNVLCSVVVVETRSTKRRLPRGRLIHLRHFCS